MFSFSAPVTKLPAGSNYTISFKIKSITAVGAWHRISLYSETTKGSCVLVDKIPHPTIGTLGVQEASFLLLKFTIVIPDVQCENCFLHIAQVVPESPMCTDPIGNCSVHYYSCAHVTINGKKPLNQISCGINSITKQPEPLFAGWPADTSRVGTYVTTGANNNAGTAAITANSLMKWVRNTSTSFLWLGDKTTMSFAMDTGSCDVGVGTVLNASVKANLYNLYASNQPTAPTPKPTGAPTAAPTSKVDAAMKALLSPIACLLWNTATSYDPAQVARFFPFLCSLSFSGRPWRYQRCHHSIRPREV